jgi:hypothetical protein
MFHLPQNSIVSEVFAFRGSTASCNVLPNRYHHGGDGHQACMGTKRCRGHGDGLAVTRVWLVTVLCGLGTQRHVKKYQQYLEQKVVIKPVSVCKPSRDQASIQRVVMPFPFSPQYFFPLSSFSLLSSPGPGSL